jgi:hypothetical protein
MRHIALAVAVCVMLSGCITRGQVKASTWLNNGLPEDLCVSEPRLRDYGFYRRLNDGRLEFMAFCNPQSVHWLSFFDQDLNTLVDKLLPERRGH